MTESRGVDLDDMSSLVSMIRKAQAGTMSEADKDDLVRWAATHGEGLLVAVVELERTINDVQEVQRGHEEAIGTLIAASRSLTTETGRSERRLDRVELNIWGGPPPAENGDRPRG